MATKFRGTMTLWAVCGPNGIEDQVSDFTLFKTRKIARLVIKEWGDIGFGDDGLYAGKVTVQLARTKGGE